MNKTVALLSSELDQLVQGSMQERILFRRINTPRNAVPAAGQCWSIRWDDAKLIAVISAVFDDFILAFPATVADHTSDGQTLSTRLADLDVNLTIWWGTETGLGYQTLDSYLGDALDSERCEQLREKFIQGVADESISTDDGIERAEIIAEAFGCLSDEEWSQDPELADAPNLSAMLQDPDLKPSALARILRTSLPDALAVIRGDRALRADEALTLGKETGISLRLTAGPLTERLRELVRVLNDPIRKQLIRELAETRGEDERVARLHIVRDVRPAAARQTRNVEVPDWETRVDLYLRQHLQS
ncbi:hypothetical protein F8279_04775 [Micromonospora sp. AMSO1212t]|uniref:hypothetical protein n=1 Tax=Micromonospora sp. AMSO1212t TaxID=2650565 RepID=UPI00124BC3FF|nr:hypothetical protein [Micromonospora sp. AMSO1212t]KAB1909016.1 hypothetical protein F8279_04775 [Micromonospora sp. AMSO1212t]